MLKTLQIGRGLAALAVCAFHLSIGIGDTRYLGERVFDQYTWRGDLGVDFFFVLSGFIIMFAHNLDIDQPQKWKTYIAKRFIRVFPIYWLYTLIFTLLVLAGFGTAAKIPNTLIEWISTFSLIRLEKFTTPLQPAWTLFHEIGFYIVFSALIFSRKWGIAIFILWMSIIVYFFHYAAFDQKTPFSTYFSAYNLDFLIGIGAYYLWRRGKSIEGYIWLALGVICLITTLIYESKGFHHSTFPLLYGLAFGGILSGVTVLETKYDNINIPLATLIGNASYTIYLTHESVMGVVMKILIKLNKFLHLSPEILYFLILILTIIGGCILYKWIEVPIINFLRTRLLKREKLN